MMNYKSELRAKAKVMSQFWFDHLQCSRVAHHSRSTCKVISRFERFQYGDSGCAMIIRPVKFWSCPKKEPGSGNGSPVGAGGSKEDYQLDTRQGDRKPDSFGRPNSMATATSGALGLTVTAR